MSLAKAGALGGEAFAKAMKNQKRLGIATTVGAGTAAAGSLVAAANSASAKEAGNSYNSDVYINNRGKSGDDASIAAAELLSQTMAENRGSNGGSYTTQSSDTTSSGWEDMLPWILGIGGFILFVSLMKGGRR